MVFEGGRQIHTFLFILMPVLLRASIETDTTATSQSSYECLTPLDLPALTKVKNCTNHDLKNGNRIPHNTSNLKVEHSHLLSIENDSFCNLENLTSLILRKNGIYSIAPNSFRFNVKLQVLDLGENELSDIPDKLFEPLVELKWLHLDNNFLKSVHSLQCVPHLQFLDFSGNYAPDILEHFPVMTNLQVLVLENVGIYFFGNAFNSFPNLCLLSLAGNRMTQQELTSVLMSFQPDTLRSLSLANQNPDNTQQTDKPDNNYNFASTLVSAKKNLTYLDLSRMQISVCEQILYNYPYLKTLNLSSASLNTIPDCIQNSTIENLNLTSNDISKWNTNLSFPNLKVLILDRNTFESISDPDMMKPFPNLRVLSISRNSISQMGSYTFHHLQYLESLDLSQNDLDMIENYTFSGLVSLRSLYLYNNNIKIYPNNRPFEKLYNLTSLVFHHNSLCQIWPWVLPDQINLNYLDFSQNKIEYWKERAFGSNKKLEVVLLSDNELCKFSEMMLEELSEPHFKLFDITGNVFECDDCSMQNLQKWFDIQNNKSICSITSSYNCSLYQNVSCQNGDSKPNVVNYRMLKPHKQCKKRGLDSDTNLLAISISLLGMAIFIVVISIVLYRQRWYVKYYWYMWFGKYWIRPRKGVPASHTYSAYISYSESDRLWLQNKFLPSLENQNTNLSFYVLERDFEPGRYLIENILEGMEKSSCFVALLSKDYLQNTWRVWEFNWAVCRLVSQYADCPSVLVINLGNVKEDEMTSTMRSVVNSQAHFKWSQEGPKEKLLLEKLQLTLAKHCVNNNTTNASNNNTLEDQRTRL